MVFLRSHRGRATGAVLASCASVQLGSALAARLMSATGSEGATALRLSLAAVGLLLLTRPRVSTWNDRQWRAALALGLCLVGMNGSFYLALARIPLGTAVTLEFLGPLTLSALGSRRGRDFLWVGWALAGVILLSGHGGTEGALDPLGVCLALLAGGFWALYILATARVGAEISGLGGLAVATGAAAAIAMPFGLSGASVLLSQPELIGLAVATAVLASMIPYSLELSAMRSLPPRTFGILLSLEPAVAAAMGWALLGQSLTPLAGLGMLMVITASIGTVLGERPSPDGAPSPLPSGGEVRHPLEGEAVNPVSAGQVPSEGR